MMRNKQAITVSPESRIEMSMCQKIMSTLIRLQTVSFTRDYPAFTSSGVTTCSW
jgi:hypothetical protein